MQGVDSLASLLDISGNGVRDELVDNLLQVGGADLSLDDVDHLLPDVLHLGALSVEGGQTVLALNILHDQLELPEGTLGVVLVLEIGQRHLEDAALESHLKRSWFRQSCSPGSCRPDG